jgi:hypothetical protein
MAHLASHNLILPTTDIFNDTGTETINIYPPESLLADEVDLTPGDTAKLGSTLRSSRILEYRLFREIGEISDTPLCKILNVELLGESLSSSVIGDSDI